MAPTSSASTSTSTAECSNTHGIRTERSAASDNMDFTLSNQAPRPATLYHYQPYNPEYLSDLLTRQRIHCASPAKLNDPWDSQPWYNRKAMDDPENLARYIDWLNNFQPDPTTAGLSALLGQAIGKHNEVNK